MNPERPQNPLFDERLLREFEDLSTFVADNLDNPDVIAARAKGKQGISPHGRAFLEEKAVNSYLRLINDPDQLPEVVQALEQKLEELLSPGEDEGVDVACANGA